MLFRKAYDDETQLFQLAVGLGILGLLAIGFVVGAVDEYRQAVIFVEEVRIDTSSRERVLGPVGFEVAVLLHMSQPGFLQGAGRHPLQLGTVLLRCPALGAQCRSGLR